MADLGKLKKFDIDNSIVTLWVFKKSTRNGQVIFTGRWVETSNDLDESIKQNIKDAIGNVLEIREYSLLAENNESSVLSIPCDETHAGAIIDACVPRPEKKVKNLKEMQNSDFYAVKLQFNDKDALFAIKSTDDSWKLKKLAGAYRAAFKDNALDLDKTPTFNISKAVDFFIFDDEVIAKVKNKTESILSYKEAHKEDFKSLQLDVSFSSLFTDMAAISAYVGDNKIQLRRASAIKQKEHYKNATYIKNIRDNSVKMKLLIDFDANGKMIATEVSCKYIFLALLNHRLYSVFSENYYDVQNTETI